MPMFIIALVTIVKTRTQSKCSLTEERIKKKWYIYAMKFYPAIKKNEILPFPAKWMNLESVIMSEVRQRRNII